jgi:single-strand DNA-binding protein
MWESIWNWRGRIGTKKRTGARGGSAPSARRNALPDSSHILSAGGTALRVLNSGIVSLSEEPEIMKSVNKVILVGNLGKDPEVKYTPQGTPVAKITIATGDRYKDKDGNWQDRPTEWHNVVLWQRMAEIAGQYLKKGNKVYIEGRLQTHSWDDKQTGQKKYMTEIIANDLVLMGGRGEGGGDYAGGSRGTAASSGGNNFDQSTPQAEPAPAGAGPITDEDIPF